MDIQIERLNNTKENITLVANLMKKDVSEKCFVNKDLEGNIVSYREMAKIFLKYAKLYAIVVDKNKIGLLIISNGNEIGMFIEPDFQGMEIATEVLGILKKELPYNEAVVEIATDNDPAIKSCLKNGFIETDEKRTVTINSKSVLVKKYVNPNFK